MAVASAGQDQGGSEADACGNGVAIFIGVSQFFAIRKAHAPGNP